MAKLTTRSAHEVKRFVRSGPPYMEPGNRTEIVVRSDGAVLRKAVFPKFSDGWKRWPVAERVLREKGIEALTQNLTSTTQGFRVV